MKLQLVGCSHHQSNIRARERLAFTPDQTRDAVCDLQRAFPDSEAVVLSTCNRVEVYTATDGTIPGPSHQEVAEFLARFHGLTVDEIFDDLFDRKGEDVVRHLFMVAASLDSMVLGEPQILSQVKQAYEQANALNTAGPITHSIFQTAVRVARRVANETTINQRRVSIPSIAVADFANQIFEHFDDKQILVIGAGEMAEETLRYLQDEGAKDVKVINRNQQRAEQLAHQWQGRAEAWESLGPLLAQADLVISTTGAGEPIVTLEDYEKIEPERFQKPLFILDLAIPRDFDPAIGERLGVYLYSIDDLKETCERNRKQREKELPAAMRIIDQETSRFMADLHHRATGPMIQRLKTGWAKPKEEELARLLNKLPGLDEPEREEIRKSFDRLINKLLHPPLESLRSEAQHGTPHALLEALKRLFHLKD